MHPFATKPLSDERKLQLARTLFGVPNCLKFGDFTLASGQRSPYYLDLRVLISTVEERRTVADAYAEVLDGVEMDLLVGIPEPPLILTGMIADRLSVPCLGVRKQAKDHGTGDRFYGNYEQGQRVVMLEDVMTTGGSMINFAQCLEGAKLIVIGGVVAADRQQGGADNMADKGYATASLLTISEILEILRQDGLLVVDFYNTAKEYVATKMAEAAEGAVQV